MSDILCEKCGTALQVGSFPFCHGNPADHAGSTYYAGSTIFPFTLPHVDGKPMTINSLQHLRQVESKYGVAFTAFNQRHDILDPLKSLDRYKGDDPDFRGRR